MREALDGDGPGRLPKTGGGEGLHILVPVSAVTATTEVRLFVAVVARALERHLPGAGHPRGAKTERRGVLIDANQNGLGTDHRLGVYSVRPRPGAPVSTPLRWDEVDPGLDPREFTIAEVCAAVGAPWRPRRRLLAQPPAAAVLAEQRGQTPLFRRRSSRRRRSASTPNISEMPLIGFASGGRLGRPSRRSRPARPAPAAPPCCAPSRRSSAPRRPA